MMEFFWLLLFFLAVQVIIFFSFSFWHSTERCVASCNWELATNGSAAGATTVLFGTQDMEFRCVMWIIRFYFYSSFCELCSIADCEGNIWEAFSFIELHNVVVDCYVFLFKLIFFPVCLTSCGLYSQ